MQAEKVRACLYGKDGFQAWVLVRDNLARTWVRASEILGESIEKGIFDRNQDALDYGNKAMKSLKKSH